MLTKLEAARLIQAKYQDTTFWDLQKYGLIIGLDTDEFEWLDKPSFPLFDFDMFDCEDEKPLYFLEKYIWHDDCPLRVGVGYGNALWAKLVAFTFGYTLEHKPEEYQLIIDMLSSRKVTTLGYPNKGCLAMLLETEQIEVNDIENFQEIEGLTLMSDKAYQQVKAQIDESLEEAFANFLDNVVTASVPKWELSIDPVEYLNLILPKNLDSQHSIMDLTIEIHEPNESNNFWKPTVVFPDIRRSTRYYYGSTQNDAILGVEFMAQCFTQWIALGTPLAQIRQGLFRDATDILAPATNYGSPGSLNIQIALGDVGFVKFITDELKYSTPFVTINNTGCFGIPQNVEYPNREETIKAFHGQGIIVFPHHQMSHIRVGPAAAGVGLSFLFNDDGCFVLTDKGVDKETKIPNRLSLQTRTPCRMKATFVVEDKMNEDELADMLDL